MDFRKVFVFSLKSAEIKVFVIFICVWSALSGNINGTSFPKSSLPQSPSAFSSEPDNARKVKVQSGDKEYEFVTVNIPDKSKSKVYYPSLNLQSNSSQASQENETIARNGTMISGLASRYGKREAKSYYSHYPTNMGVGYPTYSSGRYYGHPYRYEVSDGPSPSWGGKWLKQLKRRTSMMMNPSKMQSMENQQMQMHMLNEEGTGAADEPDMAGTFLSGWGSGYGKSKVNRSAVGLLGFLSLLSLIQNVLNQTMPMAMTQRKRRDISKKEIMGERFDLDPWSGIAKQATEIGPLIMPILNSVNLSMNRKRKLECTLHYICVGNKELTDQLGERGKSIGITLSENIAGTLKLIDEKWNTGAWDIKRKSVLAGIAGRNNKSCSELYPPCLDL